MSTGGAKSEHNGLSTVRVANPSSFFRLVVGLFVVVKDIEE